MTTAVTFPTFPPRARRGAWARSWWGKAWIKALEETSMFKPVTIGRLQLEHKVVLAPLTRMRGSKEADCVFYPGDLNVEYYSQRASKGGFMLTEACPISRLVSVEIFMS